jgi:hypothetical protein
LRPAPRGRKRPWPVEVAALGAWPRIAADASGRGRTTAPNTVPGFYI